MYELKKKKIERYWDRALVHKKRFYRAAVSQRLRNAVLCHEINK